MPVPKADSVFVSENTEGDYLVRKYEVRNDADTGYELFYPISNSTLNASFDDNARSMESLGAFLASFEGDSPLTMRRITITGYASPDGPVALNRRLAEGRAKSLRNYVDKKFDLSKKYTVHIDAVPLDWNAAREAVAASSVPEREAVLRIIDRRDAVTAKSAELKAMPEVWNYLAANILPSLRYADITFEYTDRRLVEQRTLIPRPEPEIVVIDEEPCDPCCCVDTEAAISGLIVEMPDVPSDF